MILCMTDDQTGALRSAIDIDSLAIALHLTEFAALDIGYPRLCDAQRFCGLSLRQATLRGLSEIRIFFIAKSISWAENAVATRPTN
jgi:hypothetical protein